MDRAKMLQVLGPAAGAAAVVVLVGVLVAMNDSAATSTAKGPVAKGEPDKTDTSDTGMSDGMPSPDAKEWQAKPNGLKVWDVKEGEGTAATAAATVLCHYTGWLADGGTVFDSSRSRGQPIDFPLNGVIKGWTQGIPGMKPGGIRRLYIPADLGYGVQGTPDGKIPPNAPLIFEVKLLKVL